MTINMGDNIAQCIAKSSKYIEERIILARKFSVKVIYAGETLHDHTYYFSDGSAYTVSYSEGPAKEIKE